MTSKPVTVKLDSREQLYLEKLARESGRTKSQVLQRLILFAANSEDALRALGAWDYRTNQPKRVDIPPDLRACDS